MALELIAHGKGKELHDYLKEEMRMTIEFDEYFKENNSWHIKIDYYDWDKAEEFLIEDFENEYFQDQRWYDKEYFDHYEIIFYMINYVEAEEMNAIDFITNNRGEALFDCFASWYIKNELWPDHLYEAKVKWLERKKKRCKMDVSLYDILFVKQPNFPHQLAETGNIYINIMSYLDCW